MTFRRKCAKCGRLIEVVAEKASRLGGKQVVCRGKSAEDGCWERADLVKKRGQTVLCIMGRRVISE